MRSKKNRVVEYLDSLYRDQRDRIVNWAVSRARKERLASRKKQAEVRKELSKRAALKVQKKNERAKKDLENKLKKLDIGDIENVFPELDETTRVDLEGILSGKVVGKKMVHTWYDEDINDLIVYSAKIEKRQKRNSSM